MTGVRVLYERHEIDLTTGWCSIHQADCGSQIEFEAWAYQPPELEVERPVLEARRCVSIHVHDSHDWSWGGQSFTCPGVSDG